MAALLPFLPAIIGAATDIGMYAWQRHDAGEAHQREVEDLAKAGINPLMTAQTRGTPVVPAPNIGQDIQSGIASGLAIRAQASEIQRAKAQAAAASAAALSSTASARLTGIQADVQSALANYQVEQARGNAQRADLEAQRLSLLLPFVAVQARQEILSSAAGARNANALAVLNELAKNGRVNQSNLDKTIGTYGPFSQLMLEMLERGIGIAQGMDK